MVETCPHARPHAPSDWAPVGWPPADLGDERCRHPGGDAM